jgi:hypothetical protein
MFPTSKGEKFRKHFWRALAPLLAGQSTMHGTPEKTDFLIHLVSHPYILSDKDGTAFLTKLCKADECYPKRRLAGCAPDDGNIYG